MWKTPRDAARSLWMRGVRYDLPNDDPPLTPIEVDPPKYPEIIIEETPGSRGEEKPPQGNAEGIIEALEMALRNTPRDRLQKLRKELVKAVTNMGAFSVVVGTVALALLPGYWSVIVTVGGLGAMTWGANQLVNLIDEILAGG